MEWRTKHHTAWSGEQNITQHGVENKTSHSMEWKTKHHTAWSGEQNITQHGVENKTITDARKCHCRRQGLEGK